MSVGQLLAVLPPDWGGNAAAVAALRRTAPVHSAAPARAAPAFPTPVAAPVRPPAGPRRSRALLVGAHGGAGVTTLARLLAPATDAGVARDWRLLFNPAADPVALVTGSTVAATGHAVREVGAAIQAGVAVRLLLVVADGWPVPKPARARLRLLAAHVGNVIHMPYVPAWRYLERPDVADVPRSLAKALADARAAFDHAAVGRP